MSLSTREILLVLRARDEASRVLGRVSGTMRRMDRDAFISANNTIKQQEANLLGMRRHVHDISYEYQKASIAARELHQSGKIDAQQYSRMMLDARKLRVEQTEALRQMKNQAEDEIRAAHDRIAVMHQEREALRHRGQALMSAGYGATTAGAAMTYFGAVGVAAMMSNVKAAMDYQTQVKRTFTQVDKGAASLKQVDKLGKEVAKSLPVAFEDVQPAIYDIFSSFDVGYQGARKLVKQFSRDAVGGASTLETATRANLQIMNAFKVKVKDASKVSDFMFRLVQKGVGTYDEFAKAIGRAIPSAARAGQTYQTLGGMMAFMTRNGLTAAMAATSSARALDAISNSKVVERLQKMNIQVKDAQGEFLPLSKILDQMNDKYKDMTSPERAKALQELFLGAGGTIQARRFFDAYFKNADEFNQRTKEMTNASGRAKKAFDQMASSPGAKVQQLKNDWQLFRIELGEHLMPIAFKLIDWATALFNWWDKLDPSTRNLIAKLALLAAGILVVVGVLTTLSGILLIINGGLNVMGIKAATAASKMGRAVGGISVFADGMNRVHSSTTTASKSIGILESAAGGAVAGSIFGPWGTAIGGLVGGLGGVWMAMKNGKKTVEEVKPAYASYKDSLDQITGATTRATRAAVLHNMELSGTLDAAQGAGVSIRDMIDATLGNDEALKRVNKTFKDNSSILDGLTKKKLGDWIARNSLRIRQQSADIRRHNALLQSWNQELKGVPKEVKTKLNLMDYEPTKKQWEHLIKLGHLTKKQQKIVIDAIGFDPAIKKTKDLNKHLKDTGKAKPKMNGWKDPLINALTDGERSTTQHVKSIKAHLQSIEDSKPANVKRWGNGLMGDLNRAAAGTQKEVRTIIKLLSDGPAAARANLAPFKQHLTNDITGLKSTAGTGGNQIGNALGAGVHSGIIGWTSDIIGAAQSAVAQAIAAAKARAKIHSPSKETEYIGKMMSKGLAQGMERESHHLNAVAKKIISKILSSMKDGFFKSSDVMSIAKSFLSKRKGLSADQKKNMLQGVAKATGNEVKKLERVTKRYHNVLKALDNAKTKLQNLKDEQKSYIDSVRSSIQSFGSFSNFQTTTDVFGNTEDWTVGNITSQLQSRLATIKEFGKNLKKLLQMGFSKNVYDQVVQMGPEAGAAFAAALIQATPDQVKQINNLASDISSNANTIAQTAGSEMYDAGIAAAEGLVKGLESKKKDLEKVAETLGKLIAKVIRRELGIKSPSRVAHAIGKNFGLSLANSMHAQRKHVAGAAQALADATHVDAWDPTMAYSNSAGVRRPPVVGGDASGAPGQKIDKYVDKMEVNIHTNEIDPRKHGQELGYELFGPGGRI